MGTRQVLFESLEPRLLLSGNPSAVLANDIADGLDSTTLQLTTNETLVLGISPHDLVGEVDLFGIKFSLDSDLTDVGLELGGTITEGHYYQDGKIDLSGKGHLISDFKQTGDDFTSVMAADGEIIVNINQSAFQFVELEQVVAEADIQIGQGTLELAGSVDGKYENNKIDFDGELSVKGDFTHQFGEKVSVTLKDGGKLDVDVEKSEFKGAELDALLVAAQIDIDGQDLNLQGAVSGKVHEDYKIDFYGELSVKEDFTHRFGEKVSVTLKDGGKLDVEVEKSEFKGAEFDELLVDAQIEIDGQDLNLQGAVNGKVHEDYKIDFAGSGRTLHELKLNWPDATMVKIKPGGQVGVKVERSEFKGARGSDLDAVAVVPVESTEIELKGKVTWEAAGDGMVEIAGEMAVSDTFTHQTGRTTLRIFEGERVNLFANSRQAATVDLTGIAIEADIALPRDRDLELAGSVIEGSIVNGQLDLDADLDMRSPLVMVSSRWYSIELVALEVDLSLEDGVVDDIALSRPIIEFKPLWRLPSNG